MDIITKYLKECCKPLHIFSYFTILASIVLTIVLVYWAIYPYNPVTVNNEPMPVDMKEYSAGDTMHYTLDYCKNNDLPVKITKRFVDTVWYGVPEYTVKNEGGCRIGTFGTSVPSLPAGEYVMEITYTYEVNPIRHVVRTIRTQPFNIVE